MICGYFDVQGFYHNGIFYSREFALLGKHGCSVYSVDHGLKWEMLSEQEKLSAMHCIHFVHGLPFTGRDGLALNKVRGLIRSFWAVHSDPEHMFMGIKSPEAEAVLRKCSIPCINLTKYGATWTAIRGSTSPCYQHVRDGKCSYVAVNGMKQWVKKNMEGQQDHFIFGDVDWSIKK